MTSNPSVSLTEAAKRSGISTTTIRRWITDGKIEAVVKTATGYRIPVQSLLKLLPGNSWDTVTPIATSPGNELVELELKHAQQTIADLREQLAKAETRNEQANATVAQLAEVVAKQAARELTAGLSKRQQRRLDRETRKQAPSPT
jgi:excisionase family DNA binding protein